MLLTDLNELKRVLQIDARNPSEDVQLNFFAEWASDLIQKYLDRDLEYKSRTEYYDGSGTLQLRLRTRPVYQTPTPVVNVDQGGFWGEASGGFLATTQLVYGQDYFLKIDTDDGTSSCGLLIRRGDWWPKNFSRFRGLLAPFVTPGYGCVKVTYTAGYTVDTLPSQIRAACDLLVARLRYLFPLGMELSSESYEERHISLLAARKDYLLSLVKPMIFQYRNWSM